MKPLEFVGFLKTVSDMELLELQHEARQCEDKDTVRAALVELGRRRKEVMPRDAVH